MTGTEAVIPGTGLDLCPGSPSHPLSAFTPSHSSFFLVAAWACHPGPLCLSQRAPVCSVSGKRMSCPDSGNAQSIEISGRGGLGPWLLSEEGRVLGGRPEVPRFTVGGGGARILLSLGPAPGSRVHPARPLVTPASWAGVSHSRENPGGQASLPPCSASAAEVSCSSLPGPPLEMVLLLAAPLLCLLGAGRGWVGPGSGHGLVGLGW